MRRRALALVCLFPIAACSEPVAPASPGAFAAVAGGFEHTCALLGGGLAYCWGRNTSFQLGTNRTNEHDSLPQQVSAPFPFTKIDAGQYHSCGLVASGAAYCWGIGPDGALKPLAEKDGWYGDIHMKTISAVGTQKPPVAPTAPADQTILEVKNIEVVFNDVILVLRGLSLAARRGAADRAWPRRAK